MAKAFPAARVAKMKPAHPGEILREDVFPALKISIVEAARNLGLVVHDHMIIARDGHTSFKSRGLI